MKWQITGIVRLRTRSATKIKQSSSDPHYVQRLALVVAVYLLCQFAHALLNLLLRVYTAQIVVRESPRWTGESCASLQEVWRSCSSSHPLRPPLTLRAASFLNKQDRSGLRRSYHGSCGWESPDPHDLFPTFQHWPELALPPRNLPLTKQLLQFPELSASQRPKLVAGSPVSQKQSVRQFLRVHGATTPFDYTP